MRTKTKLIATLTALSVLAFPASVMAAQKTQTSYVCTVQGCQITGKHSHSANATAQACTVNGCQINGQHTHNANENGHMNHSSTEHAGSGGQGTGAFRGAHH